MVTRSPSFQAPTPSPSPAITPAHSCPMVMGGIRRPELPSKPCMSLPQIPQASISTRTSPGRGSGSGTSLTTPVAYISTIPLSPFRFRDAVLAARRAAVERMRPILLTTVTSVAGLLPLAIAGDSTSSESWRTLALSATGGLIASAVFTLLLIPVLFTVFARQRQGSEHSTPTYPN